MQTLNLQGVLSQRPLGLVFDIDGTLSPYVPAPYAAQLYPGVAAMLEQAQKYAHVAILTSRPVDDGAAMVNIAGLTYIGNYGLEWSESLPSSQTIQIMPEALDYIEPGKHLLDLAEQQLVGVPTIIVEQRRIGGAVRYHLSPHPEQARQMILSVLQEPARQANMRLDQGELVIEVRAPFVDKGNALRRFAQRFGLHGIIFAGDDLPDLGAFNEVSRLRQEGIAGLSIVVQHVHSSPTLLAQADIVVQEVEGMVQLLHEMVNLLQRCG